MNRSLETNYSHKNYVTEYLPRRNRLAHSLLFEQFEMLVERWQDLQAEYETNKDGMLAEVEKPEA